MQPTAHRRPRLGMDAGKRSHWACLVDGNGEIVVNRPVNTEADLDAPFADVSADTLVVVDQVRSIGTLPITRARMAGLELEYLTGAAAHEVSRMLAGDVKTGERDAFVIAERRSAYPMPCCPCPTTASRSPPLGR